MVIRTLCETLGFTKLSKVLKYFVYDGGRLSGKFIICMKTCLCIPFNSASLKRKKVMQVCISSIALSRNIQKQVLKPFLSRATLHTIVLIQGISQLRVKRISALIRTQILIFANILGPTCSLVRPSYSSVYFLFF